MKFYDCIEKNKDKNIIALIEKKKKDNKEMNEQFAGKYLI